MRGGRSGGAVAAAVLGIFVALSAAADDKVRTRAWDHKDYGRIVFDWPAAVDYTAEIAERELVVRFARPLITVFDVVTLNLRRYIAAVRVGEARRMVVFTLADDFDLKTHRFANKVVIDLWWQAPGARRAARPPPDAESAPAIEAVAVEPVQEAPIDPAALPALAPAAGPTPVPRLDRVPLRYGEHPGFSRLVFDWNRWVDYKVGRGDGRAHITFDRPAGIDLTAVNRDPPRHISDLGGSGTDDALTVDFAVPGAARLRYFRMGTKVVLDVLLPDDGVNETAPVALAHATGDSREPVSVPDPPPPGAAAAAPPRPLLPEAAPRPAASAPSSPALVVRAQPGERSLSLDFDWPAEVAAAAFRRAGFIWLVFDRPAELDLSQVRGAAGAVLDGIEQVPVPVGTALRLAARPGINPSLRRREDAAGWRVELAERPLRPNAGIEVDVAPRPADDAAGPPELVLALDGVGEVVEIADPEVGDTLWVAPLRGPDTGVDGDRTYVQFRLLGTAQGVAVEPRMDALKMVRRADGVALVGADPRLVSPMQEVADGGGAPDPVTADTAPAEAIDDPGPRTRIPTGDPPPARPPPEVARLAPDQALYDFAAWRREGPFSVVRRDLHARLATVSAERRSGPRLRLAQISMAHGMAADALAALDAIADEDPALAAHPETKALRAAALFATGRFDAAAVIFADPAFDGNREADFWRAAFAALENDAAGAVRLLRRSGFVPADYPAALRAELQLATARAALEFGDAQLGAVLMDDLLKFRTSDEQRAEIDLLRARLLYESDDIEGALGLWEDLALGRAKRTAARAAFAAVDALLRQDRIDKRQAIERLEKLRFVWRGDDFEFNLLRRLGSLYLEVEEYGRGLVALRQAVTYYPERKPEVAAIAQRMTEAFARLFGPAASVTLPPLQALALYDQFRELTPAGHDGDLMTQKLAERLAEVDLLDRAGELLEHQVRYRLVGEDKARVGARLAQIRLQDRRPDLALAAIQASAVGGVSRRLVDDRKRLQARALSELGRGDDAIALIAEDSGRDADLLRAEIYRRQRAWRKASDVLGRVVEKTLARRAESRQEPVGLDRETAQLILELAVATVLDGDLDRVARLRTRYGAAMAALPEGEAFALIASSSDPPDDPRVLAKDSGGADRFQAFMSKYHERLTAAAPTE